MSPECLYWIVLALCVLPSLPFNRVALVVLSVWAFGHFAHFAGGYESVAYMIARIVAIGAGLGLARPWDGSRRALAQISVALLFAPSAAMSAFVSIYPDAGYSTLTAAYWTTWGCIMAQAALVPVGNDWERIRRIGRNADHWIMRRVANHFGVFE